MLHTEMEMSKRGDDGSGKTYLQQLAHQSLKLYISDVHSKLYARPYLGQDRIFRRAEGRCARDEL